MGGKYRLLLSCWLGLPIFRLREVERWTGRSASAIELNESERRIYERLGPLFEQERLRMARALASGSAVWQEGVRTPRQGA